MIEIVQGLPENVVGIVVKGRVTKKDCSEVLLPALEKRLQWHHRLRLYYEIRSRFPGAGWEEVGLGIEHGALWEWERAAIVTDVAWIRHAVQALRLLIPSEIRLFTASQMPEGLAWIAGAPLRRREPASFAATRSNGVESRSFRPPPQYLDEGFR